MPLDRRIDDQGWDRQCLPRDSVDALLASWQVRRPELDFTPVGVISRLARVRSHIDYAIAALFEEHGLGGPDFAVLVTLARIGEDGRISQRRLMDELGLTSGTISVRMNRLVEAGLVDRQDDPQSKRNTLITLTAGGRELFERVVPAHISNERRLLASLSDSEEQTLAALLRKLLVEFEGSDPATDAPPRLGLTLAPAHVAIKMRESVGLPAVPRLLVRAVEEDAAADRAGIRTGDLLLNAGKHELRAIAGLYAAIDDAASAGRLKLTLLRGVDQQSVTINLGAGQGRDGTPAVTAGRSTRGNHKI
jgi:DNA-binding MarR family transcriptional regulator